MVHHLPEQILHLCLNSVGQRLDLGLDGLRQRLELLLDVASQGLQLGLDLLQEWLHLSLALLKVSATAEQAQELVMFGAQTFDTLLRRLNCQKYFMLICCHPYSTFI